MTRRRNWLALWLLLVGAVVNLPALRSPFLLDDYIHASMVDGTFPAPRGPFDLYNFVTELRTRLPDPAHTEVVITQGLANAFFLPFALDFQDEMPARWRILAEMGHALVQRRGPRTLEIVVPPGHALVAPGPGNLLRNNELPMAVGDTFDVPGVHVTVLEIGKEGPRAARYEFDRDLEDPSLVWITEKNGAFPATPPPKIGFGVTLDP